VVLSMMLVHCLMISTISTINLQMIEKRQMLSTLKDAHDHLLLLRVAGDLLFLMEGNCRFLMICKLMTGIVEIINSNVHRHATTKAPWPRH